MIKKVSRKNGRLWKKTLKKGRKRVTRNRGVKKIRKMRIRGVKKISKMRIRGGQRMSKRMIKIIGRMTRKTLQGGTNLKLCLYNSPGKGICQKQSVYKTGRCARHGCPGPKREKPPHGGCGQDKPSSEELCASCKAKDSVKKEEFYSVSLDIYPWFYNIKTKPTVVDGHISTDSLNEVNDIFKDPNKPDGTFMVCESGVSNTPFYIFIKYNFTGFPDSIRSFIIEEKDAYLPDHATYGITKIYRLVGSPSTLPDHISIPHLVNYYKQNQIEQEEDGCNTKLTFPYLFSLKRATAIDSHETISRGQIVPDQSFIKDDEIIITGEVNHEGKIEGYKYIFTEDSIGFNNSLPPPSFFNFPLSKVLIIPE